MRGPVPLLAQCGLLGGIAIGTALTWFHLTQTRTLSAGAVIVCTGISVLAALGVEEMARRARRGRRRRAHARTQPTERTHP